MAGLVMFALSLIAAVILFLVLAYSWGALTFEELPDFSAGEEPTTVKRLPEIDLPLDMDDDD